MNGSFSTIQHYAVCRLSLVERSLRDTALVRREAKITSNVCKGFIDWLSSAGLHISVPLGNRLRIEKFFRSLLQGRVTEKIDTICVGIHHLQRISWSLVECSREFW